MLNLTYQDDHHVTVNSTPSLQVAGRHRSRQLWREMQGAYQGYVKASTALERLVTGPPLSIWRTDDPRVGRLMAEQRVSFENYIDARLRFVEFHHDQNIVAAHDWTLPNREIDGTTWRGSVEWRLLIAANVILLALTIFSSWYVLREQKHIREHSLISQRIPASADQPGIHSRANAMPPEDPRPPAVAPESASAPNMTAADAKAKPGSAKPSNSAKTFYPFRLAPSKQLRQVGSTRISVGSVDPRRQKLTVSFLAGSAIVQRRIRRNVPVWINSRPGTPPIKLVVTRIEANRVQGYVLESANKSVAVSMSHSGGATAGKS